jgi:hypothetical protein
MVVSGQLHALSALPPGKQLPAHIVRRQGGPQSWSGIPWKKNFSCPRRELNPVRSFRPLPLKQAFKLMSRRHLGEWQHSQSWPQMEVSGQLHAPATIIPRKEPPASIHWIGGLVGPRAGLDATEKRRISCPCQESNPGRPARSTTLLCIGGTNSLHSPVVCVNAQIQDCLFFLERQLIDNKRHL